MIEIKAIVAWDNGDNNSGEYNDVWGRIVRGTVNTAFNADITSKLNTNTTIIATDNITNHTNTNTTSRYH